MLHLKWYLVLFLLYISVNSCSCVFYSSHFHLFFFVFVAGCTGPGVIVFSGGTCLHWAKSTKYVILSEQLSTIITIRSKSMNRHVIKHFTAFFAINCEQVYEQANRYKQISKHMIKHFTESPASNNERADEQAYKQTKREIFHHDSCKWT